MKIDSVAVGFLQTNCYLLCDETALVCALIDPGAESVRIKRMIDDSGCALRYILLTHGHFDHTYAIDALLRQYPDVPVYIHRADASDSHGNKLKFARLSDHNQRYYADGDTLALGNLTVTVLETPGHSAGSVCLLCENALFSGDTLFRMSCGRTDFPDGDAAQMLRSLARLGRLIGEYRILPGHEAESLLSFERMNNPYMKQALAL
ncbi:MAG: MBL fold metallo-hydrolase [Oscillospiraceae bacterium]|nr:MBL fold metallo-hydrolase [Oscillospiraceae bacterium]